jgi:DNA-binding transcriptional ArsR family regulator
METLDRLAELFKVLMHPTRLAILEALRPGEQCVCHLEATLNLSQSYISQHLAVLRQADLVAARREGWNVYYRVSQPEIFAVLDAASVMLAESVAELRPAACACPKCQGKPLNTLVEPRPSPSRSAATPAGVPAQIGENG